MPSPRALVGVAPALLVLVGSLALSREYRREAESSDKARSNSETMIWPSAEDEERLHRTALKQEAIEDLLNGRLTLAEAVERFEMLSASPEAQTNMRLSVRGSTDEERALKQVLAFARIRAAQEPKRFDAALARLEAEANLPAAAPGEPGSGPRPLPLPPRAE